MIKNEVGKGAIFLYIQLISSMVSGYIFLILLARITTPEIIGTFSLLVSFSEIFANIAIIGLPDSIQHDVSGIKTYIFKRKKTKNKLTLLLDISSNQFKWEYNASGQCLLMQHTSANPKNWNRTTTYTRNLYYNPDGTLSKIVKENDGQIETIKYSYAK